MSEEKQPDSKTDSAANGVYVFTHPPTYYWEPKEDITTFELAKCQAMFVAGMTNYGEIRTVFEGLPEEAKRHWRIHPSQNDESIHPESKP